MRLRREVEREGRHGVLEILDLVRTQIIRPHEEERKQEGTR